MSQNEMTDVAIVQNAEICGMRVVSRGFDLANRVLWRMKQRVRERFPYQNAFTGWDMRTPEYRALMLAERAIVECARESFELERA